MDEGRTGRSGTPPRRADSLPDSTEVRRDASVCSKSSCKRRTECSDHTGEHGTTLRWGSMGREPSTQLGELTSNEHELNTRATWQLIPADREGVIPVT